MYTCNKCYNMYTVVCVHLGKRKELIVQYLNNDVLFKSDFDSQGWAFRYPVVCLFICRYVALFRGYLSSLSNLVSVLCT